MLPYLQSFAMRASGAKVEGQLIIVIVIATHHLPQGLMLACEEQTAEIEGVDRERFACPSLRFLVAAQSLEHQRLQCACLVIVPIANERAVHLVESVLEPALQGRNLRA